MFLDKFFNKERQEMKTIKVTNQKYIGLNEPYFIIAEVGANNKCDLSIAKELIDVARDSGADAIKFQTY